MNLTCRIERNLPFISLGHPTRFTSSEVSLKWGCCWRTGNNASCCFKCCFLQRSQSIKWRCIKSAEYPCTAIDRKLKFRYCNSGEVKTTSWPRAMEGKSKESLLPTPRDAGEIVPAGPCTALALSQKHCKPSFTRLSFGRSGPPFWKE